MLARPPFLLVLVLLPASVSPSAGAWGDLPGGAGDSRLPPAIEVAWYCGRLAAWHEPAEPEEPPREGEHGWPEAGAQEPSEEESHNVSASLDVDACVRIVDEACGVAGRACCEIGHVRPCESWGAVAGPWFQVGQEVPGAGGVCVTLLTEPKADLAVEQRNCWERPPTGGVRRGGVDLPVGTGLEARWHPLA